MSRPGAPRRLLLPLVSLLAAGCAGNTPMNTLMARSDYARSIRDLYWLVTWITLAIAVGVLITLVAFLVRFRERPDRPLPPQTVGHTALEIAWTVAPALVLLGIAIPTIHVAFRTQPGAAPPGSLAVTVVAHQWWWEFRYPELGVVTANELHLPTGRPVALKLTGADVIHSFWVPQLGGKRDVIPGRTNWIDLTPEVTGDYWGQCAEFCGTAHANMRLRVLVESPAAFERWIAVQRSAAAEPTGAATEGRRLFAANACVGCHTIRGVSAGVLGPDLTHFGSRRTFAAGLFPNAVEHVALWIHDPARLKPGAKMPRLGLTDAEARAIATYLETLK